MNNSVSQELLKFLQKSPTAFHAVQQMKSELLAVDFTELKENQRWNIECGKHYFVTRNDSSLIAFTIPENGIDKMHILTSHSDSPTFKIKENPEIEVEKHYVKLNVEKYGGNEKEVKVMGDVVRDGWGEGGEWISLGGFGGRK